MERGRACAVALVFINLVDLELVARADRLPCGAVVVPEGALFALVALEGVVLGGAEPGGVGPEIRLYGPRPRRGDARCRWRSPPSVPGC